MLSDAQITALKLLGYTYTERVVSKNGLAIAVNPLSVFSPAGWHLFQWNLTPEEAQVLKTILCPENDS